MGLLTKIAGSPAALLACVVAGVGIGRLFPELGAVTALPGQLYLGIVGMASLPLLVVATFFGLRQVLGLPQPGRRMAMVATLAVFLVFLCALTGTLVGWFAEPGRDLDHSTRGYLGGLVQSAGAQAGDSEMTLAVPPTAPQASATAWLSDLVPDNFFRALADGSSLGILICAILFGLAFAALGKSNNSALTSSFEAIYRALESIISRVNLFIPLMVFSMAAFFAARTDMRTLAAMSGFIGWFVSLALLLAVLALSIVRAQCGLAASEVMAALKAPALIALTSASTTASIPDTIEAMSSRLGFSRGIVEMVTPLASVFMRSGSALYFALATIFVANLYGRTLGPEELAMTCVGACIAAFASSGTTSLTNVAFAGMVLTLLELPAEAALALFLAVDVMCESPRNLLTLMFTCALIALVSRGLPSERVSRDAAGPAAAEPVRFAFTRGELVVGLGCVVLAAALVVVLGIGIGMRSASHARAGPPTLGLENAGFAK